MSKSARRPRESAADATPAAADPLIFCLFLLTPVVWSSAPAEPFLPVKTLLLACLAAAAAISAASRLLDWARSLRLNPPDAAVAAMTCWAVLSAAASNSAGASFRALLDALPFLLVFALLRTSVDSRRAAVSALLAACVANALAGFTQMAGTRAALFGVGEEPIGLMGNRNHLAALLAVALPLFFWRPRDEPGGETRGGASHVLPESETGGAEPGSPPLAPVKGRDLRPPIGHEALWRLGSAAICLVALALTGCRGAFLAVMAASFVFYSTTNRRARSLAPATVFVLASGALILIASPTPTARARALTWRLTAQGALVRPLLGHGPGSFENEFARLQETHFRGLDRDQSRLAAGEWQVARNHRQAHNDWLQAVFELGLPAGLLLALVASMALGLPVSRTGDKDVSPATLAAVVSLGVLGLTSFPLRTPATALEAALVAALALPLWNPRRLLPGDFGWPLWPKAWLGVACAVMAGRSAVLYLAEAEAGAGRRLLAAGRPAEAEKHLQKAVFLNAQDGRARAALARVFEATGRDEHALAAFRDAAADHLDSAAAINEAVVLRKLGRKAEALEGFRRAVAMLPSDSDSWYFLGMALAENGDAAGARTALRRAKELSVENLKAWYEAARLALRQEGPAEARRMFGDNVIWLSARMTEEDPSLRTVDPLKRDYLSRNAEELSKLLESSGRAAEAAALRGDVDRYYGRAPSPK